MFIRLEGGSEDKSEGACDDKAGREGIRNDDADDCAIVAIDFDRCCQTMGLSTSAS
jgi:hypothetical protein